MSGDLFPPMDEVSGWENATKRNPLLCYLCNEQFEDPRILPCFHSFCSRCLRGRIAGAKILCPLCGVTAQLKEDQSLPPSDSLLKFLIESSSEEKALCANCETAHSHMFFCNTCTQPLCGRCREETHKARMFSSHEIVLMSKRTKDIHKLCKLHDEPYIMFSTEKKVMLCINCFRDMKVESRSHCVDLETAYKQGCKKLDRAVQALYDLQNSVRDGILLLRVLLEEVRRNAVAEKHAIDTLCDNIQSRVLERKTQLEEEVERQYKAKESLFKAQLVTLTTMLPTIHVNLVTSAAFAGSANKHEFLDLAYSLMGRLTSIVQHQQLFPNQTSNINSDYKAQIAKCLEPLLFPYYSKGDNSQNSLPLTRPTASQPLPMPNIRLELPTTAPSATNAPSSGVTVVSYGPNGGRRGNNHGSKVKFIDAKGVFAEHCVEFDNSHRDLLQKLEKLKSVVQELHRDLTLRRTVAKNCKVSEFKGQVSEVDEQLIQHYEYLDQKRLTLEKHWEESLQRIGNEQELYQAQMSDVLRLKQECQHLKTIVTQLSPFVESISKVTERIVPKLGDFSSSSSRENQIHALFEQINTMQPDSKQRVDAIKSAEEEREMLSANRTNPLDEELIKTKGLLRAPVARRESGSKRDFKDTAVPVKDSAAAKDLEQLNDAQSKGETSAGLTTAEAAAATNPNFDNEASKALKKGDTVTESETGGCGFGLRNIDLQNGLSSAILNASGGQSGYTKTVNINGQLSKKDETVRNSNDNQLSPRVDETGDGQSTMTINGTVVPPEMHDIAGEQGKAVGVCVCLSDSDSNLLRKGSITSRESQKAAILPNKVQVCDKSCEVFANCETYSSKMPKLRSDQNEAEVPNSAQSYRKALNTHTHVSNGERACENKLEAEHTSSSS